MHYSRPEQNTWNGERVTKGDQKSIIVSFFCGSDSLYHPISQPLGLDVSSDFWWFLHRSRARLILSASCCTRCGTKHQSLGYPPVIKGCNGKSWKIHERPLEREVSMIINGKIEERLSMVDFPLPRLTTQ